MFTQLLASQPVRQPSTTGVTTSIAVHGLFVGAAVFATMGTASHVTRPVQQSVIYIPPASPPPKMPAPPQVPAQVWVQRALTLGIVFPSVTPGILPALPELGPQAPVDFKGPMRAGAGESALTSPPDVEPGTPYLATQVEVQVGIAQGSPMPKYPNILRSSGMEGSARFRFVVDTLGHVEMGTVEQILTSHEAFSVAVRSTLPRMRFTPATVGGRPVRQLVELPIIFKIQR